MSTKEIQKNKKKMTFEFSNTKNEDYSSYLDPFENIVVSINQKENASEISNNPTMSQAKEETYFVSNMETNGASKCSNQKNSLCQNLDEMEPMYNANSDSYNFLYGQESNIKQNNTNTPYKSNNITQNSKNNGLFGEPNRGFNKNVMSPE